MGRIDELNEKFKTKIVSIKKNIETIRKYSEMKNTMYNTIQMKK